MKKLKRKIIQINDKKCNGCANCIPDCPEGALQMIDGKARLISDLFCDGLGACIGSCPQGAIKVVEREAEPYNEKKVMQNIVKQGKNTIIAHLKHLKEHGETKYLNEALAVLKEKKIKVDFEWEHKHAHEENLPCGCPGSAMREVKAEKITAEKNIKETALNKSTSKSTSVSTKLPSELRQWPVQLNLLPVQAPFFEGKDLLVCADCVPFAEPNFHSKLLKGKSLVIGCPKLDDINHYQEKLTQIFKHNKINSITVAIMEVPCCSGLVHAVEQAVRNSKKKIPIKTHIANIQR